MSFNKVKLHIYSNLVFEITLFIVLVMMECGLGYSVQLFDFLFAPGPFFGGVKFNPLFGK